jgi:photosystem II stability/assembly factor-like uncharacterized protein
VNLVVFIRWILPCLFFNGSVSYQYPIRFSMKPLFLLLSIVVLLSCNTYKNNSAKEENEEENEEGREVHQTGADKQLASWLWSRGYPDATNMTRKYWTAWQDYKTIKENTNSLLVNQTRMEGFGAWSSLGSVANIGGRILTIAIDPNNASNLFIGSASGGIWKSTNAGSSWSYVPTNLPVLGVSSILYHPTNSNILIAGTGEVYRTNNSNIGYNVWKARGTYGVGIVRSTDGGATWAQVFTKLTSDLFAIQQLLYDPNNANTVYACATDGLYKSTDGGITWSTTPFYAKNYVRDIAVHPTDANQIVISVGNLVDADKGIYRTTNGGSSWTKSTDIVSSFPGYIKLTNNGTRLYAAVGRGGNINNELYMSTDFGANWSLKNTSNHCGGQYWFAHDVEVDPNNADEVLMGGVSYYNYTSTNATTGGTRTGFSGGHADVHDFEFVRSNSNIIYIANDGGMYKSTNGGSSFSAINNGLIAVQFYASFAVSPSASSANVMIGGLQDNGTVRYNGTSWSSIDGGDGGPAAFHPTNDQIALYSNDARAVYHSTNSSTGTQRMLNLGYGYIPTYGIAYDDRTGFMAPLAISKSNPAIMYVASDNLHISTNGGSSFSRTDPQGASAAGMTRAIDATFKPAIALAISPVDANKVYVSTSNLSQRSDDALNVTGLPEVLKSTNASNNTSYTFSSINTSLPDRFTTDFAISTNSDDSVYITMGGFGGGHVYLTPDGGTTWLNRSTGLPDVPFNAVMIDPLRESVIYAACDLGVYVSHNKGVNWFDFNNGFWETTQVMDLQPTADNKIVAATHGKGVFRTDLFVPPITLPVTFVSFTGQNRNDDNDLTWSVEAEFNLSHYELERSVDGINFQKSGTITAANSAAPTTYNYTDNVKNIIAPVYYYRLKAVNANSTWFYSDVVLIRSNKKTTFKVMGNPFSDHLSFQYNAGAAGKMSVQLSDMKGSVIRNEEQLVTTGTAYYTINNLSSLPAGIYVLELWINRERYTEKIIKR